MKNNKLKELKNLKLRTRTIGLSKLRIIAIVCLLLFAGYSGVNATIKLGNDGTTDWSMVDNDKIRTSNGESFPMTKTGLQNAIWNFNSTYGNGTVYIPATTSNLDSQITITSFSKFTIEGIGESTFLGLGHNGTFLKFDNCTLCTVKNLRILGNKAIYDGEGYGIYFTGTSSDTSWANRIEEVTIGLFHNNGVHIKNTNTMFISNSYIESNDNADIYLEGSPNSIINNIQMENSKYGIYEDTSSTDTIISNCHVIYPTDQGFSLRSVSGGTYSNCWVNGASGTPSYCFFTASGTENKQFSNCYAKRLDGGTSAFYCGGNNHTYTGCNAEGYNAGVTQGFQITGTNNVFSSCIVHGVVTNVGYALSAGKFNVFIGCNDRGSYYATSIFPTQNVSNANAGFGWFETSTNILNVYNGTAWVSTTLT